MPPRQDFRRGSISANDVATFKIRQTMKLPLGAASPITASGGFGEQMADLAGEHSLR